MMNTLDYVQLGLFTVMIFSSLVWFLVYIRNRDTVYENPEPAQKHAVTFLVPAYNEEEHIEDTISSLLSLDYPDELVDIIAINDGSTDNTLEKFRQFDDQITILDQENQGKSAALNNALEHVDTELVACMDADSRPDPDFLQNMLGYMERDNVAGVSPALKLTHHNTLVEKIQWVEYMFQIFLRKMFAIFDVQYVLPGPGSIYRTDYLRETDGWDEDTLTEDMEIAFRMFDDGKYLENSTTAYTYTSPPSTLKALIKQRVRWYTGYIRNGLKYLHIFGRPRYGNMGVFLLPLNLVWIFISLFFFGLITYNIADIGIGHVQTYMVLGYIPMDFAFGIQNLQLFHVFFAFFIISSLITIALSLWTAKEPFDFRNKKTHYISFLLVYSLIFAVFWISTLYNTFGPGDKEW